MAHQDPELRMYAQNGLRSAEDWASLGRVVHPGTRPRARATHRRGALVLFSRDQTVLMSASAAAEAPAALEPSPAIAAADGVH